jgi:hypothetical protein
MTSDIGAATVCEKTMENLESGKGRGSSPAMAKSRVRRVVSSCQSFVIMRQLQHVQRIAVDGLASRGEFVGSLKRLLTRSTQSEKHLERNV